MVINRPEDIGALVRDRRKALRLSQADLANRLQVSQRYISHLESGKPTLQLGLVLRVLRELSVDLTVELPKSPTKSPTLKKRSKPKPIEFIDIDRLVDD